MRRLLLIRGQEFREIALMTSYGYGIACLLGAALLSLADHDMAFALFFAGMLIEALVILAKQYMEGVR